MISYDNAIGLCSEPYRPAAYLIAIYGLIWPYMSFRDFATKLQHDRSRKVRKASSSSRERGSRAEVESY
jgi:hypothetical protein